MNERRATSDERRATSDERRATSDERRATLARQSFSGGSDEPRAWYVIHTKPMSEDKVYKQFLRLVNGEKRETMDDRSLRSLGRKTMDESSLVPRPSSLVPGPEAFCPKIRSMSTLRGGSDAFQFKPLFPSYVFLRWDLSDPVKHRLVKYTRGVNRVLGDGGNPVPISDNIIGIIKERTNSGGIIEQQTFKVGDQIKVRRGLLRDLIGILERPVSDNGRVAVLLRLFNRDMRAHLRCSDITKA